MGREKKTRIEGKLYISSSQLSTFGSCRLRWKFRYIDRLPSVAGLPAVRGTFVHSVLEELFSVPPEERTIETARSIARSIWDKMPSDKEFLSLELNDEQKKLFRQEAWKSIKGLWDMEDPTTVDVVENELYFEFEVNDAVLVGYIDRVSRSNDGKLTVVDFKTGKAPSRQYRGDKLKQVVTYGAVLEETTESEVDKLMLYYLGEEIVRVKPTQDKFKAMIQEISHAVDTIRAAVESNDYVPSPGPLCAWCDFVGMCPVGQAEVKKRYAAGNVRVDAPALKILGLTPDP